MVIINILLFKFKYVIYRKVPFKLSSSRKRGIRDRLKNVECVINIINSTGIKMKSLVTLIHIIPHLLNILGQSQYDTKVLEP